MDNFQRLRRQVGAYVFSILVLSYLGTLGLFFLAVEQFALEPMLALLFCIPSSLIVAGCLTAVITHISLEPVRVIRQAILHMSSKHHTTAPPNVSQATIGRELLTTLTLQIYQLGSGLTPSSGQPKNSLADIAINNLPLPVMIVDAKQTILYANQSAHNYINTKEQLAGKNIYSSFDWLFPNERTLDSWLKTCRTNKATASTTWNRVKLQLADTTKQLDLVAYYNKDNPSGAETILAIFDRSAEYGLDDQAIDYVALAIHELRTPLTTLRGYIEVFDDELSGKLDPELAGFMHKMQASAQNLSVFVSNILNVARIENNQLTLRLQPTNWSQLVTQVVQDMMMRAQVHGKTIRLTVARALPTVGADPTGATEILTNLIDNAIKYSGDSDTIVVSVNQRSDGLVETTVQDFGTGIPVANMGNLFEKFYRNHRTRAHVGGTGLGLYLSKTLVKAHGGDIWADSKEGKGTTIGFTLLPYDKITTDGQAGDDNITRTAHGWIKNHSFYRR